MANQYKLGCNWSSALKHLLLSKAISIDYIKAGEQVNFDKKAEEMRSLSPILLHGGTGQSLRTGMLNLNQINFFTLNQLIRWCGTPQYAIHIAITQQENRNLFTDEAVFEAMSAVIRRFKNKLCVPLLIENTPDCLIERKFNRFEPYIFPDQINKLLYDNDVQLLLDLTHAKITAKYHGWDIYAYLSSLLLNRVKEIHINGWGIDKKGFPIDAHMAMEDEDYILLDWILCRTKPEIISLEYCGCRGEEDSIVSDHIIRFYRHVKGA